MDKPGCVLIQLYLQNQAEWSCPKGHGLRTPRLEQRKKESKKTGLSRSSLVNGENQTGARELRLLTEAEGIFRLQEESGPQHGLGWKVELCSPPPARVSYKVSQDSLSTPKHITHSGLLQALWQQRGGVEPEPETVLPRNPEPRPGEA